MFQWLKSKFQRWMTPDPTKKEFWKSPRPLVAMADVRPIREPVPKKVEQDFELIRNVDLALKNGKKCPTCGQ